MTTPEETLWQAVLSKAFLDAHHPVPDLKERKLVDGTIADNRPSIRQAEYVRDQARSWISTGNRDFRQVCENAGFDHEVVYAAWSKGQITSEALKSKNPVKVAA